MRRSVSACSHRGHLTRNLLPAAVAAHPDHHGTILPLLRLTTVPTAQREECGVEHHVPVHANLLLLWRVREGVEGGTSRAQVGQPVRARQPLAAGVDERVLGGEEPTDRCDVGASQRLVISAYGIPY